MSHKPSRLLRVPCITTLLSLTTKSHFLLRRTSQSSSHNCPREISKQMKDAFNTEGIKYHLVPPYCHKVNAAERAIQIFKNHLKAGLATVDPNFPLREWDRLLPQGELTLKLLRDAHSNPNLLAWAYLFGQFDYNSTSVVSPGTKVLAHSEPGHMGSWSPNGESGWSAAPALEHYRWMSCYFPSTRHDQQVNKVIFFPSVIPYREVKIEKFPAPCGNSYSPHFD